MIATLITLIVYLVILGLVFWLVQYVLGMIPLPEPFSTAARVLLAVVAVLVVIMLLLQLVGGVPRLGLG